MRITWVLGTMVLVLASAIAETEPTVYGKGVQVGKKVTVSDLLADPNRHLDKVVRVFGVILEVEPEDGRWIRITSDDGSREIVFRVLGKEIEFPPTVRGRSAVVEGTFRKLELTREQGVARAREAAEKRGAEFDPETDPIPTTMYVVEGGGAIVH